MKNILEAFAKTVRELGRNPCFHFKKNDRNGVWRTMTWDGAARAVMNLARILEARGVAAGNRVAIYSSTRVEWTIADLAILFCRAVTVPIYHTLPQERISHIIADSDIRFVFVENARLKEQIERIESSSSRKLTVFCFEDEPIVRDYDVRLADLEERAERVLPDDVASIIYTSGTTGVPKGAVITHRNIMEEVTGTSEIFRFPPGQTGFMCLPLAHVLGRLMQFLAGGYQVAYLEAFDKFAENCCEVRPDFIVGVPRIVEKMQERLAHRMENAPWVEKRIFNWALSVGKRAGQLHQKHIKLPLLLRVKHRIASKLVYEKINSRLGGKLKLFISGGAPLAGDHAKFFQAVGLLILEGYGLTETFAAATVNRPDDYHFGTVGKPVPGVEVKLASDGEILVHGPTVFREYLNMPEETRAAKTPDGWLKTGDVGEMSRDGFLRITDRKKDIIVTAGGENVAPQLIESLLMESRFINYCMVYGDRKKYLTALITLEPDAVRDYARRAGIDPDPSSIGSHPKIRELIASIIREKNANLANHETIKKFAIIGNAFSVETGELTPTLKVRRRYTAEKYKDVLESLYRE